MERAKESEIGEVVVATPDKKIFDLVKKNFGKAILTSKAHNTGTDRIYEALQIIDPNMEYDTVINIQGDLPAIESNTIKCTLTPLKNKDVGIATLAFRIIDDEDFNNSNIVKVKILLEEGRPVGRAIDFSRIMKKEKNCYHHVGVYAFRRKILERFHSLQVSEREKTENLGKTRAKARNELLSAIKPLLEKYSNENNVDLVIDKKNVIIGKSSIDITSTIIKELNQALPSLKLN